MSHVNWLGGLHKEIHHIKLLKDGSETYEPAMVILCHERKGRSFAITLEAMWKYIDPMDNDDPVTRAMDREDFGKIASKAQMRRQLSLGKYSEDLTCCALADALARSMGLLYCTSFNLAKCLTMFGITVSTQTAAQLLLWIQNELDDLRKFPEHPQDDTVGVAGEVTVWDGGKRLGTTDLTVSEADMLMDVEGPLH
jgi:hypothetical protein